MYNNGTDVHKWYKSGKIVPLRYEGIDKGLSAHAYLHMAKQAGAYRFRGSIDGLCFYKMNGEYYVRLRSSLTGKQFWKRKVFEGSRKSCKRFGEGNKLASKIYQMIEKEKREYALFCFLKKRAILLLKEGMNGQLVEAMLIDYVVGFGLIETNDPKHATPFGASEDVVFNEKYPQPFDAFPLRNNFEKLVVVRPRSAVLRGN